MNHPATIFLEVQPNGRARLRTDTFLVMFVLGIALFFALMFGLGFLASAIGMGESGTYAAVIASVIAFYAGMFFVFRAVKGEQHAVGVAGVELPGALRVVVLLCIAGLVLVSLMSLFDGTFAWQDVVRLLGAGFFLATWFGLGKTCSTRAGESRPDGDCP